MQTLRPDAVIVGHDAPDRDTFAQIQENARSSIDAMACNERGANEPEKPCIFLRPIGNWTLKPSVIARSGNAEESTHRRDAKPASISLDELVCSSRLALSFRGHGCSPIRVDGC